MINISVVFRVFKLTEIGTPRCHESAPSLEMGDKYNKNVIANVEYVVFPMENGEKIIKITDINVEYVIFRPAEMNNDV